jgi:hypothetical protein
MEDKHFSWILESPQPITKELPEAAKGPKEIFYSFFNKKTKIILLVIALVSVLFILRYSKAEKATPQYKSLEGLAPVLPIVKGEIIQGMLLRPVYVSHSSISKAQKLHLVFPEDAKDLMGKLRAKKDLPPNKPLFWNELELIKEVKQANKIKAPTVIYPE